MYIDSTMLDESVFQDAASIVCSNCKLYRQDKDTGYWECLRGFEPYTDTCPLFFDIQDAFDQCLDYFAESLNGAMEAISW